MATTPPEAGQDADHQAVQNTDQHEEQGLRREQGQQPRTDCLKHPLSPLRVPSASRSAIDGPMRSVAGHWDQIVPIVSQKSTSQAHRSRLNDHALLRNMMFPLLLVSPRRLLLFYALPE